MTRRFGVVLLFLSVVVFGAATVDAQSGNSYYGSIWAGQYTNAATYHLVVPSDCITLTVELIPEFGWEITEYHVDIVSDPMYYPLTRKGNPKIGHFQWSASFPPTTQIQSFDVLPGDVIQPVECGDLVYVAIHAVMVMRDGNGNILEEETAWGGPCGTTGNPPWQPGDPLPSGFFEWDGRRWGYYLAFQWGFPPPGVASR